jgi:ATP-dependent Lhr-like helicase
VLNVVEQLHGNTLGYQVWTSDVFPTRVPDFNERDLDELCSAGEVVWRASGSASDPRIAFYLTDALAAFAAPIERVGGQVADRIRVQLGGTGLFFPELVDRVGGFPGEVFDTLWAMIWSGEVSNDSLRPLRSLIRGASERQRTARNKSHESARRFRSRRQDAGARGKPGTEGRFTLLGATETLSPTDILLTRTRVLVKQWGVVTREAVTGTKVAGGFAAMYPVLRGMDETGELQRGYWIEGLGASQFVPRGVVNQLRLHRVAPRDESWAIVSATDPVNPYGSCFGWPEGCDPTAPRPSRLVGSVVILERGRPLVWISAGVRQLYLFRAPDDFDGDKALIRLAEVLRDHVDGRAVTSVLVEQINGEAPSIWLGYLGQLASPEIGSAATSWTSRFARALVEVGFENRPSGLARRRHSAFLTRGKA